MPFTVLELRHSAAPMVRFGDDEAEGIDALLFWP